MGMTALQGRKAPREVALRWCQGQEWSGGGVPWLGSHETKLAGNHTVGCFLVKARLPREEGQVSWTETVSWGWGPLCCWATEFLQATFLNLVQSLSTRCFAGTYARYGDGVHLYHLIPSHGPLVFLG